MGKTDLNQLFGPLRELFIDASKRWPNLESYLVTWPEDMPPPENDQVSVDVVGHYGVYVGDGGGKELNYVLLLTSGGCYDTPAGRYRSGKAGGLLLRRNFGKFFGSPHDVGDHDDLIACNERFRTLAAEGADGLKIVGTDIGLSADTLVWHGYTLWQLAVHETMKCDPPTRGGVYVVKGLRDVFLASAQAIDRWFARMATVVAAKAAGRPVVEDEIPPDTHAIVEERIEEAEDLVTKDQVAKIVHLSPRTLEKYKKDWPEPDWRHSGQSPDRWSYHRLLPKLKEQFPDKTLPDERPSNI